MNGPSVTHATFSLERRYEGPPGRVFQAWADQKAKARWFAGTNSEHQLDFRVGGREVTRGRNAEGAALVFESTYHDIVPEERIVFSSTLSAGERLATVSVTTVEFSSDGEDTRLVLTEQGTFLDSSEEPSWREQGTSKQLDALTAELKGGGTT
jgi:uncharacterized protein YndB with AHSA1/START domain